MPDGSEQLVIRTVERINQIDAADWDRCAGGDNPFVSHAFLNLLEESGSVSAKSGWLPHHLILEHQDGTVLGAMPAYLKNHSMGEYVFDHGWADAYERAGGRYYPKLQCSVPFTPVTGPRLLAAPGPERRRYQLALLSGLAQVAEKIGVTNAHITFCTEEEAGLGEEIGLLRRAGYQFHWHNDDYENFDGFLDALSSRKRKAIRKERREVAAAGITVRPYVGDEITRAQWDAFYRFYVDTYDRKWGYPYLTPDFFADLGAVMGDAVVLMLAESDGRYVAGALNFKGTEAIYGRNWGCAEDYKFLHFETCYYQAIDFAIEHGLARVEAGTQGPHKVQRGYLPAPTHSVHWIPDRGFNEAVADYLNRESMAIEREMAMMAEHSPFKKDPSEQR